MVPDADGRHVLVGSEGTFEVRDARDPEGTLRKFDDVGFFSAFNSPQGDYLLLVNSDNIFSVRQLPDYAEVQRRRAFSDDLASWNGAAHWAWDGSSIIHTSGADSRIELRRAVPARQLEFRQAAEGPANCYCYSPSGDRVFGVGQTEDLTVWDAHTGQELRRVKVGNYQSAVAVSSNGKLVAAAGELGLKVFELPDFRMLHQFDRYQTQAVQFSPDSRTVVFGGQQRQLEAWDVASGRRVNTYTASGNNAGLAFRDDGTVVAMCHGARELIMWNVQSGDVKVVGDRKSVSCTSVAFSSREQVVAAGVDDRVEIWDFRNPAAIQHAKLVGHRVKVAKLAFHPTEPRLVSLDEVGRIRVWDTATFEELMTLSVDSDSSYDSRRSFDLLFSPDGNTLVARWGVSGHRVWEADRPSVELDRRRRSVFAPHSGSMN